MIELKIRGRSHIRTAMSERGWERMALPLTVRILAPEVREKGVGFGDQQSRTIPTGDTVRSALQPVQTAHSSFGKKRLFAAAPAAVCVALIAGPLWGQNVFPASGNVGIGTTSPLNPFQVHVGPDLNLGIRPYQGSAAIGTFNDAGNLSTPMNFDASKFTFTTGNVGIGTTSPGYALSVVGSDPSRWFGLDTVGTGTGGCCGTYGTLWFGGPNGVGPTAYVSYPSPVGYSGVRLVFQTRDGQGARLDTMTLQNGNVGIGTTNPGARLDVVAPAGASTSLVLRSGGNTAGDTSDIDFASLNGTINARMWTTPSNQYTRIKSGGVLAFHAGSTSFDQTNEYMTILTSGNVGIGTTNPTSKLSVNGTIQAKEVIVNTGWSDYVFSPNYRLTPLGEVAAYIQDNHHLPEIPSASEVQERGVSLGEMQAKLLAKVEELTLHMIKSEERSNRLELQNRELQGRVESLEGHGVQRGERH